jgi:hypothetical protein
VKSSAGGDRCFPCKAALCARPGGVSLSGAVFYLLPRTPRIDAVTETLERNPNFLRILIVMATQPVNADGG